MDAAPLKAFQADGLQHFQNFRADLFLRQLFQAQAERHIFKDVQMREKRILLEHRVNLALIGRQVGDVFAIKKDIAGFWGNKPGNHAQSGRFAAAGRAKESNELFVVNVEGKPVQDLLPVKINNNVFQRYDEILIHYYCIPLCGISRYSTFFSHRFFLRPAQSA